jgi:cell wall-associated NlpC family hydrolase
VPRDADQQEAAAAPVDETDARPGDLVCFGEAGKADHIAFWLGDGRILHATAREGVNTVVEEPLANVDARPIRFARLRPLTIP